MKNQIELKSVIFIGLVFVLSLFPFTYVHGEKLQSGVTIKAPSTTETEKICDDTKDNDNDGKIDANDEDCAAAPAGPMAVTCGLQIVSGVPINYGDLTIGQASSEQMVHIKNDGTSPVPAKIMVKAGDWISDELIDGAPMMISGPEATKVSYSGSTPVYDEKTSLSSNAQEFGHLPSGQEAEILFQFRLDNAPSGSVGAFHQDVTIDLLCGGNEFLKEDETKGDYNTTAKTPNTQSPVPIPYPDTNNITGTQIRAD